MMERSAAAVCSTAAAGNNLHKIFRIIAKAFHRKIKPMKGFMNNVLKYAIDA